ncbi:MAG: biopolymer transporter ExbD [Cyanobacteria bacterium P01_F01_bin.153]
MRFKQSRQSEIPDVNVLPMLNLLMGVLAFFVVISLSLSGSQIAGVRLPSSKGEDGGNSVFDENSSKIRPLSVGLSETGEIFVEGEPVELAALAPAISQYFQENPDGSVILQADKELKFEEIKKILVTLKDVGSDRIGLAFEP